MDGASTAWSIIHSSKDSSPFENKYLGQDERTVDHRDIWPTIYCLWNECKRMNESQLVTCEGDRSNGTEETLYCENGLLSIRIYELNVSLDGKAKRGRVL